MWHNIPTELRELPQWVCAGPNKIPLNPRTGGAASTTDPATWATFEEACRSGAKYIGFILSESDPYTIIDLDNKVDDPVTPEQWAIHERILNAFESYTERSASGRGYHIIIRGRLPAGVHNRDKVEAYSRARFMICTGDAVRQVPIRDYQFLLDQLFKEMQPAPTTDLDESYEGILDDRDLVEMASHAANGDKYVQLCCGDWQAMGYPSQSEADFALLSMLAYYTQDNEQVRRLFRMSALGKREKATRDNVYLNRALQKIRAKQPEPVDISGLAAKAAEVLSSAPVPSVDPPPPPPPPPNLTLVTPPPPVPSEGFSSPVATFTPVAIKDVSLPPGLIGEMALYFYQTAIRPAPEVALSAAIALTAGVCGRSYNISGTGLNQYLILIAKTGIGKEGAGSGIDNMIAALRPTIPMVDDFIGPSAFASGQALIKVLDERPCFVSVLGEFGLTLQQLCDERANAAQIMLRKVLLDLYTKSGYSKVLRSSVYSDVEKNTKVVSAPAVTILGESTPERFFESLDSSHISEGLIPRFMVVQYTGQRPRRNPNANQPPPEPLVKRFADLVAVSLAAAHNNSCFAVQTDHEAQVLLDDLDRTCDDRINSAQNDAESQLWNRAHLKALKLGALLAVGVNPHQPIVTGGLAQWAIDFVNRDVTVMSTRFRQGDVGNGDGKLAFDVRRLIRAYLTSSYKAVAQYGVEEYMHKDKVIPYVYLQRRTCNLAPFKADRRGATGALRSAIEVATDSGVLVEVPAPQMKSKYGTQAKAYCPGPAWNKFSAITD